MQRGRPGLRVDFTGQRCGLLVALEPMPGLVQPGQKRKWRCRCDCGNETVVSAGNLKTGHTRSCGCLYRKHDYDRADPDTKKVFHIWKHMLRRCYVVTDRQDYPRWGARGITVCDEWRSSFKQFLADMGPRPSPEHQIDRIDNDGPYCPENCRWATPTEQARNRRNTRLYTHNGETKTLKEWSDQFNIKRSTLAQRVYGMKWDFERALTTPVAPWRR
jgi:hypothetical protein